MFVPPSTRALKLALTIAALACALGLDSTARAQGVTAPPPPEVTAIAVQEHLGASVPLDVTFRDHTGAPVALSALVHGRPIVLNLMYHRCAMLCSVVLDSLATALRGVDWSVGAQFDVVTLSIDPRDTPDIAARKRGQILEKYGRSSAATGWHFLVGDEASVRRVADAVGFEYRWDAEGEQWIHPAAIFVVGGDGRIARYLYGVDFEPRDVRFGLLEASEGRTVSTIDRILLACYHWDPKGRRYVMVVPRVMRIGGAAILLVVGGSLAMLWRRDRERTRREKG